MKGRSALQSSQLRAQRRSRRRPSRAFASSSRSAPCQSRTTRKASRKLCAAADDAAIAARSRRVKSGLKSRRAICRAVGRLRRCQCARFPAVSPANSFAVSTRRWNGRRGRRLDGSGPAQARSGVQPALLDVHRLSVCVDVDPTALIAQCSRRVSARRSDACFDKRPPRSSAAPRITLAPAGSAFASGPVAPAPRSSSCSRVKTWATMHSAERSRLLLHWMACVSLATVSSFVICDRRALDARAAALV